MKKILIIFASLLIFFSFTGCDTADIEVGTKDGVAYFYVGSITPKMLLLGENEIEFENDEFFEKLVSSIEFKQTVDAVCNCQPVYTVKIKKYTFELHSHGITVKYPMGNNIKGVNVFSVSCTNEEMTALFEIIEKIK